MQMWNSTAEENHNSEQFYTVNTSYMGDENILAPTHWGYHTPELPRPPDSFLDGLNSASSGQGFLVENPINQFLGSGDSLDAFPEAIETDSRFDSNH